MELPVSLDWDLRSPNNKLRRFENQIIQDVSPSRSLTNIGSSESRSRSPRAVHCTESTEVDELEIKQERIMKEALRSYQNELIPSAIKKTVGHTGFQPKFAKGSESDIPPPNREIATWGYTGYYPGRAANDALGRSGTARTENFIKTSKLLSGGPSGKFHNAFETVERRHQDGPDTFETDDDVSEDKPMKTALSNSSSRRGIWGYTGHESFYKDDAFHIEEKQVCPVLGYTGYYEGRITPVIEELKQHPLSLAEQFKHKSKERLRSDLQKSGKYVKPPIIFGSDMYYHKNRQFRRPITPINPNK